MGLDMKTKKKLSEETAKRYCTAGKKQKTKILDEFIATTGYNRKYAIHVLKNSAYVKLTHFNNVARQSVQVITKTRKKRKYEKYYGQAVQQEVIRLWIFSMYLCSKRLVPFIRDNIDYFSQKFGYDEQLKAKQPLKTSTDGRGYNQKQVLEQNLSSTDVQGCTSVEKRDSRQNTQAWNLKTFHSRYFNNTACKES